jgi:hypothetical protein
MTKLVHRGNEIDDEEKQSKSPIKSDRIQSCDFHDEFFIIVFELVYEIVPRFLPKVCVDEL